MIHFYGSPMSSSGRTHWVLEEAGVAYEYHRVSPRDPAGKATLVAAGSAGRIPFLVDGDLKLEESLAINAYLVERYAPQLWATTPAVCAQLNAWSLWSVTNLQPLVIKMMMHAHYLPAEQRNPVEGEAGRAGAQKLLEELETRLTADHLVDGRLTLADLNVGSVVNLAERAGGLTLGPRTTAWMVALRARPSYAAIVAAQ